MNVNPFGHGSSPLACVFRVNAKLINTKYVWTFNNKVEAFPLVDIQKEFLYYIYGVSFSADISLLDYQASLEIEDISTNTPRQPDANTIPTFNLYLKSENSGSILRQPFAIPTYYSDVDYRFFKKPKTASGTGSTTSGGLAGLTGEQINSLQGSFNGTLIQTPNLVGKQSINLIATIFIQEITSDKQIQNFRSEALHHGK
jgi:hypothetical protein